MTNHPNRNGQYYAMTDLSQAAGVVKTLRHLVSTPGVQLICRNAADLIESLLAERDDGEPF